MFRKSIVPFILALIALVGVSLGSPTISKRGPPAILMPGSYRIQNVRTNTTVRSPIGNDKVLYVSNEVLAKPAIDVWSLAGVSGASTGTYTLRSFSGKFVQAENDPNAPVELGGSPKNWLFRQSNAGQPGQLVIIAPEDHALVWTVEHPEDLHYSEIRLEKGGVGNEQVWTLERLDSQ